MPDKKREGLPATARCEAAASFTIDAIRAAGTPCPDTSAMSSPTCVIRNDVVVKIACHEAHGHIPGGYLEVHGNRKFAWQNRQLDATGYLQFVLDFF